MTIRTTALALCYSTAEYPAPSMGKVLYTPTESRIESGMTSHYWMSKANKRRELVFARGNFPLLKSEEVYVQEWKEPNR